MLPYGFREIFYFASNETSIRMYLILVYTKNIHALLIKRVFFFTNVSYYETRRKKLTSRRDIIIPLNYYSTNDYSANIEAK